MKIDKDLVRFMLEDFGLVLFCVGMFLLSTVAFFAYFWR